MSSHDFGNQFDSHPSMSWPLLPLTVFMVGLRVHCAIKCFKSVSNPIYIYRIFLTMKTVVFKSATCFHSNFCSFFCCF